CEIRAELQSFFPAVHTIPGARCPLLPELDSSRPPRPAVRSVCGKSSRERKEQNTAQAKSRFCPGRRLISLAFLSGAESKRADRSRSRSAWSSAANAAIDAPAPADPWRRANAQLSRTAAALAFPAGRACLAQREFQLPIVLPTPGKWGIRRAAHPT